MKKEFFCAVKAVIIKNNKVLILKRSKSEVKKSVLIKEVWDLPGGMVNFGETTEAALFRELKEETKLKVKLVKILDVKDIFRNNVHMIILTFLCEYIDGEVELSHEHDEFHWVTIEEAEEKKVPFWMTEKFVNAIDEYNRI